MERARCRRAWQAEAVEDGRLSKRDRASFERHAATCATCTREADALARLRRTALQVNRQIPDEVTLRRLRGVLLEEAHRQRADRSRSQKPLAAILVVVALTAVLVAMGALHRSRSGPVAAPAVVSVADAPGFDFIDMPSFLWQTRRLHRHRPRRGDEP
jgi:anti-sigma factor RsiW